MKTLSEPITLVLGPRDRFSTVETCIQNVIKFTPEPYELYVVLGKCPKHIVERIKKRFGSKVNLILEDRFLSGAEVRNLGLARSKTRLTVSVDTDTYVRSGWIQPLIDCQVETGAAMVAPLILDRQNQLHTAGNNFYITQRDGRSYASMEILYQNQNYCQSCNLKRAQIDCAEIHLQLVVTEIAKSCQIYDDKLRELIEFNTGLTLQRAGHKVYFEPKSVVYLHYVERITSVDDAGLHQWKWGDAGMMECFKIFYDRWGLDVNYKNRYRTFLHNIDRRVGGLTRLCPTPLSVYLDRTIHKAVKSAAIRLKLYF